MSVLVIKPSIDTKGGKAILSRLGLTRDVDILLQPEESIREILTNRPKVHCILVDEANFLTPAQAEELFWYASLEDVPVLAYGIRNDFTTKGFPGSTRLLELAHELQEIKTICRCGRKAVLNGRKINGEFVREGSQVEIDDKEHVEYEALCAVDYSKLVLGNK